MSGDGKENKYHHQQYDILAFSAMIINPLLGGTVLNTVWSGYLTVLTFGQIFQLNTSQLNTR